MRDDERDTLCTILRRCKIEGEAAALSADEQSVLTKLQHSIRDHLAARRRGCPSPFASERAHSTSQFGSSFIGGDASLATAVAPPAQLASAGHASAVVEILGEIEVESQGDLAEAQPSDTALEAMQP